MGAPTVYNWDDPGAPEWLSTVDGPYEVLKACLVDGYPGKAGAGWSVVYDDWIGSGNFSIANAAQSGVLGLWHPRTSVTQYAPVLYVADGMLSANQPINGRSGGVDISDTAVLGLTNTSLHNVYAKGAASKRWVLVANESFALLITAGANGSAVVQVSDPVFSQLVASSSAVVLIGFGALRASNGTGGGEAALLGNFCVFGGGSYNSNLSYMLSSMRLPDMSISPLTYRNGLMTPLNLSTNSPCPQVIHVSQIIEVLLYSSDSSNSSEGAYQLGRVPGLLAFRDIGRIGSQQKLDDNHLGGTTWKDVQTLSGRSCLFGYLYPHGSIVPAVVSLDAGDW